MNLKKDGKITFYTFLEVVKLYTIKSQLWNIIQENKW